MAKITKECIFFRVYVIGEESFEQQNRKCSHTRHKSYSRGTLARLPERLAYGIYIADDESLRDDILGYRQAVGDGVR
jgi:hypothetical protein